MNQQEYECPVCRQRYFDHTAHLHSACGVVMPTSEPEAVVELPREFAKPSEVIIEPETAKQAEPAKVKGKRGPKPKVK